LKSGGNLLKKLRQKNKLAQKGEKNGFITGD